MRAPRLELGETAFLEVADVGPFGAFFDWGLPKNLLVPHAEQTRPLSVGDRHPISLYVDPSGRLAGTMRVAERVSEPAPGTMHVGDWVSGEAWRRDHAIGLFVLVERRWVGRLPADEPHQLRRGERASFRIAAVLPDGKLELSLRKTGGEQRDADAERVLAELSRPGALPVSEAASPEELRARFGLSKKAFKRAVGGLLRRGAIDIEGSGRIVPRRG